MTKSDDELIVRSAIAEPADLPMDIASRLGEERTFTLLTAASAIAILRKYPTKPDQARVREFVESLQLRFPDAAHLIEPIALEAMIRFAFDEDDAMDGLDPEGLRTAVFLLPYAIVSEQNISGESLDAFVAEVLETADE